MKKIIVFFIWIPIVIGSMDVSAQSVQGSTKNNRFDNFLAMFSTVNCLDSMVNVCDLILMRDIKESSDVNDNIREWASPIVPFFQQTPIAKFADEYGWCVLILNSYRVANIEMSFIDIVTFSIDGVIKDRVYLSYLDEHGGLYYELDNMRSNQGRILLNHNTIKHEWFEETSDGSKLITINRYTIDVSGKINTKSVTVDSR